MSSKLSLIFGWFIMHRSQLQIAIITIIFALAVAGMLVPQMRLFAEDAGGGGH